MVGKISGNLGSYLIMHRSNILASAAPFSGGVDSPYKVPTSKIPVLLEWGGPTDYAGSYDFDAGNKDFSRRLKENGQFVIDCIGTQGHNYPDDDNFMWHFLRDHPKDITSEPYRNGLPSDFPQNCRIA